MLELVKAVKGNRSRKRKTKKQAGRKGKRKRSVSLQVILIFGGTSMFILYSAQAADESEADSVPSDPDDEDNDNGSEIRLKWSGKVVSAQKKRFVVENTGVRHAIPAKTDFGEAYHCLNLFVTDAMMELLVVETNRYYEPNKPVGRNSRDWKPLTVEEFRDFVAVTIIMSFHTVPSIEHYWSSDPLLRVPAIQQVMGRSRYQQILRFLHLVDNDKLPVFGEPGYRKSGKIAHFLELFRQQCSDDSN